MSWSRRDGVALFYEEAGVGEPPILLVHGLACDHTHLTPQLEHFSDDHRVVAVDLRGHGQAARFPGALVAGLPFRPGVQRQEGRARPGVQRGYEKRQKGFRGAGGQPGRRSGDTPRDQDRLGRRGSRHPGGGRRERRTNAGGGRAPGFGGRTILHAGRRLRRYPQGRGRSGLDRSGGEDVLVLK